MVVILQSFQINVAQGHTDYRVAVNMSKAKLECKLVVI